MEERDITIKISKKFFDEKVLQYIIRNNENFKVIEKQNEYSSLHYAIEEENIAAIKKLVAIGEDINADDDYAIKYAMVADNTELEKVLIKLGANVSFWDNFLLRKARKLEQYDIVRLIRKKYPQLL